MMNRINVYGFYWILSYSQGLNFGSCCPDRTCSEDTEANTETTCTNCWFHASETCKGRQELLYRQAKSFSALQKTLFIALTL